MKRDDDNERDVPAEDSSSNHLDRPHSVIWRILHGTCFLFGGLFFICGSCMYFTKVIARVNDALNIGAWLYILGSACFLLADLQDWFHYRVGLFLARERSAKSIKILDVNFFASITGSVLYLVGSVFFLPKLSDSILVGDGLFIAGSAAIYLSEGWKIARLAKARHDLQAIFISLFAGLGGMFYFVGTILFLPQYITTDFGEDRAAVLFVVGGVFFSLAGFLLQYRYYCRPRK